MMRNEEEAIDLSQEAWVKGWQRLAQSGRIQFRDLDDAIVINLCLGPVAQAEAAALRVHRGHEEESGGGRAADAVVTNKPDGRARAAELRQRIDKALSQLSHEHRTVIVLHD